MHWFSFIFGLLIGWVIEWVIDLAYWRRRYYQCTESAASLRTELTRARSDLAAGRARTDEVERLQGELGAAQARIGELEGRLAALRDASHAGEFQASVSAVQDADLVTPTAERGAFAAAAGAIAKVVQPDDLVLIEGIGPAISRLLQDNGIHTFADLAETTTEALRAILAAAGPRYRMADPATWPEQARLAARGNFEALNKFQDRLKGGRA